MYKLYYRNKATFLYAKIREQHLRLPAQIEFTDQFLKAVFDKKSFFSFSHFIGVADCKHPYLMPRKKLVTPTGRFLVALMTRMLISDTDPKDIYNLLQIDSAYEMMRLDDDLELRDIIMINGIQFYDLNPVFVFDNQSSDYYSILMQK